MGFLSVKHQKQLSFVFVSLSVTRLFLSSFYVSVPSENHFFSEDSGLPCSIGSVTKAPPLLLWKSFVYLEVGLF